MPVPMVIYPMTVGLLLGLKWICGVACCMSFYISSG
jgi:hypothetical protein